MEDSRWKMQRIHVFVGKMSKGQSVTVLNGNSLQPSCNLVCSRQEKYARTRVKRIEGCNTVHIFFSFKACTVCVDVNLRRVFFAISDITYKHILYSQYA